ncbi:hypothetical protein M404DRAFT_19165 [Pisolithus tinctorius Marx 270]|uniref:Uncharacterized protein n=1 Tax=Pisolithus tinctorius Marx 270 TaxID=870435 RepID=A0A0C3PEQ5_PISTI|nr:hypothetical protein M404DRAFT_19165 [Pisolithus tinctorius Marx 270]
MSTTLTAGEFNVPSTSAATNSASTAITTEEDEGPRCDISMESPPPPSSLSSVNLETFSFQTLSSPSHLTSGSTSTGNLRPPHSNASSQGKRPFTEISDTDPAARSNFLELPYANTISSVDTRPSMKKRRGANIGEPLPAMSMTDAMVIAAAGSSSCNTRVQAPLPEEPPNPLLVTLLGAVTQLAGSIERTMQLAEERLSSKKQSAIRIVEEEHADLSIDQRISLFKLIREDDYIQMF